MNAVLPYHKGVLLQKWRGKGGVFSSLFRTLLPIGKTILKSSPKIIKSTARSPLGRILRKSAKKVTLNAAKNLIESGDIKQTRRKSIEGSKQEVSNALNSSKPSRKWKQNVQSHCKLKKYHFLKWIPDHNHWLTVSTIGK